MNKVLQYVILKTAAMLIKTRPRLSFLFLYSLLLTAECSLIKDPPEFKGAQTTPDSSKIIYLYSVFHYTSYPKQGGLMSQSGYRKNYFDVYDAVSGKKAE